MEIKGANSMSMKSNTASAGGITPARGKWHLEVEQIEVEGAGPCYTAGLYRDGAVVLPAAIGAVGRSWGTRFTVYTHGEIWGVVGASAELVYRVFARFLARTWERPEIKYNTFTLESMMTDALSSSNRKHVSSVELKDFEPFIDPNRL